MMEATTEGHGGGGGKKISLSANRRGAAGRGASWFCFPARTRRRQWGPASEEKQAQYEARRSLLEEDEISAKSFPHSRP